VLFLRPQLVVVSNCRMKQQRFFKHAAFSALSGSESKKRDIRSQGSREVRMRVLKGRTHLPKGYARKIIYAV